MPYNWNGEYVPSKVDRTTDLLGHKELGGIGQLVYHAICFKEYDTDYFGSDYCAYPVCDAKNPPEFPTDESVSGQAFVTLPAKSLILIIRFRMSP